MHLGKEAGKWNEAEGGLFATKQRSDATPFHVSKLAQRCNALSCFEASAAMQKQEHIFALRRLALHALKFSGNTRCLASSFISGLTKVHMQLVAKEAGIVFEKESGLMPMQRGGRL